MGLRQGKICSTHICAYFEHISEFSGIFMFVHIFVENPSKYRLQMIFFYFLDIPKFLEPPKDQFFFEKFKRCLEVLKVISTSF
jgi:hypothetical protein